MWIFLLYVYLKPFNHVCLKISQTSYNINRTKFSTVFSNQTMVVCQNNLTKNHWWPYTSSYLISGCSHTMVQQSTSKQARIDCRVSRSSDRMPFGIHLLQDCHRRLRMLPPAQCNLLQRRSALLPPRLHLWCLSGNMQQSGETLDLTIFRTYMGVSVGVRSFRQPESENILLELWRAFVFQGTWIIIVDWSPASTFRAL